MGIDELIEYLIATDPPGIQPWPHGGRDGARRKYSLNKNEDEGEAGEQSSLKKM